MNAEGLKVCKKCMYFHQHNGEFKSTDCYSSYMLKHNHSVDGWGNTVSSIISKRKMIFNPHFILPIDCPYTLEHTII